MADDLAQAIALSLNDTGEGSPPLAAAAALIAGLSSLNGSTPYTHMRKYDAHRANLTDDAAESIATGQCHPLTGKVVVRYGSNILEADHDLRQEIFDGEALRIGQEEFTVLKRPGAHKMVLSRLQ